MPLGFIEQAQGAFAEQVHVPVADHNLVELPDGVSSVDMAGLGCRFMTSFHALAHRADVGAGDWVSIHGCGGVGLSAVHIADALGANVVAVDLKDEKLEKAEGLGAVETVNAEDVDDVPGEVKGSPTAALTSRWTRSASRRPARTPSRVSMLAASTFRSVSRPRTNRA